jgi:RNA polymerase sigma-70 factor (ECF subfamily)
MDQVIKENYRFGGSPANEPDGSIVYQFNGDNKQAFESIYKELYPHVFFFACRFVGKDDAADMTSDAFLKLCRGEKQFESIRKIKIFLQVCVRNACLNHLQKTRIRQRRNRDLAQLLEQSDEPEFELSEVKSVVIKRILQEIEKLPAGAREIFKLSVIEGIDSKEIAKRLGKSHSTVRNQKKRAISLIRIALVNFLHLIVFFLVIPE